MTREQQEKLVQHLETLARAQPKRYRRHVALLAALGYCYVYLLLALILCILGLMLWILLGPGVSNLLWVLLLLALAVPLLGTCGVLLSAMQIRFEHPTGLRLDRHRARSLFEAIDALASAMKSSRVHEIFLTTDMNAALRQQPRLGLFGWYRNTLQIGLPLLAAL